jgi:S-formylglutathione hydrolase FrmB
MSVLDHLSLLHGIVFRGVLAVAVAGLGVAIVRRNRRWWSVTLPLLVAASAAPVAGLTWYLRHSGTVKDHYPPTFGLWIGASLLALLVVIAGWRSASHWRRAVAVATVPLTFASAFLLINSHYGYWLTLGDLIGRPLPDQISSQALANLLGGPTNPMAHDGLDPNGSFGERPAHGGRPLAGGANPIVGAARNQVMGAAGKPVASGGVRAAAAGRPVAAVPESGRHLPGRPPRTTAVPAPAPLSALHGVLAPLDIPPGTSRFEHRKGALYLPPAFFDTPRPQLPVIVMLGGTPGGPEDWTRGGFASHTADAYATQHQGVAPVLAFVDHNGTFTKDTECVDGPAGNAETFLSDDAPRFLAAMLHVPLDPQHWAIAGFSEGGTCAFELGVGHPDVYGTFLDFGGDRAPNLGSSTDTLRKLYGGDRAAMAAHDPANLLRPPRFRNVNGWFMAGASDSGHVAVADSLARAARSAGITVSEKILPGSHNWQFAAAAFRAVLPTVAQQLGAVPGVPAPEPATGPGTGGA